MRLPGKCHTTVGFCGKANSRAACYWQTGESGLGNGQSRSDHDLIALMATTACSSGRFQMLSW